MALLAAKWFRPASSTSKRRTTRQNRESGWQVAPLEPRQMLAGDAGAEVGFAIDLRGETGQERVEIWVGDYNLGNQFLSTQWQRFELDVDSSGFRPDEIQVRFVNDLYDPTFGFDRNVYVGTLFLNGAEVDPNAENIFSTGTWRAEDGVIAGTGRGSVLHANGYLQFGEPQGSRLTVYARGDEGSERFLLRAGSEDFQPMTVSTELQAYEFFLNEQVSSNAIRIEYFNDRYQPSFGIDLNLTVDRIELDGVVIQTESPDVFMTGGFFDGARQQGFLQSETLFTNGFIQYGATSPDGPRFVPASSVSGEGLIEFDSQNFARATSLSDGSYVGASQSFFAFTPESVVVEVFDSQGNIDASFNDGNGVDLLPVLQQALPGNSTLASWRLEDLLSDSQDRIIAAGTANVTGSDGQSQPLDFAIRITRNGDVDASYGTAGVAVLPGLNSEGSPRYTIDVLDRLIAVDRQTITRLTNVGQPDQSFGQGGVASYQTTTENQTVESVATRADRSLVVLTSDVTTFDPDGDGNVSYVYQFNEDGTVGTWFGDAGVVSIPEQRQNADLAFSEVYRSFVLDSSGRIVLRGRNTLIRLTANGQFDPGFGSNGVVVLPNDAVSDGQFFRFGVVSGPVIDGQGRIVLGAEVGFIRLDAFGQLDPTFSRDGYGGVTNPEGIVAFDVSDLQIDALGRLFSPIRTINSPAIAVWELV